MRTPAEFSATLRRRPGSGRASSGGIVVHFAPALDPALRDGAMTTDEVARLPRIGFVVPKAAGNAVARNRVRRQLRALLRERLSALPSGSCLVVRVSAEAAGSSSQALARALDACLARVMRSADAGSSALVMPSLTAR